MSVRELPKTVAAGDEIEVQLAPLGEWPVTGKDEKGQPKELTQVVDAAACAAVAGKFSKELLVDLDHASVDGGSTRAYAWVTGLRADAAQGLVGTFRFTEAGAEAVNSREYRFVSVSWFLDKAGRPTELDSVALTNRPNLPVRPILNRKGTGNTLENKTERKPNMDKIKEMLGLPADATGEQVSNAVAGLKERVTALEAGAKEAAAEKFAADNAGKADAAALKNAYLASPEAAKALVAGIAAPKPQQVLNAAAAQKPAIAPPAHTKEALAALPPSKRADYYADHSSEIDG